MLKKNWTNRKKPFFDLFQVTRRTATRSDSRELYVEVYACVSCGRYFYKFRFASRGCLVPVKTIKDM